MNELIGEIYTYLVTAGWQVTAKSQWKKNSKILVPLALKTTLLQGEQTSSLQITPANCQEIYTGLVSLWKREQMQTATEAQEAVEANLLNYLPDRTEVLNRDLSAVMGGCATYYRDSQGTAVYMIRVSETGSQWAITNTIAEGFTLLSPARMKSLRRAYISTMQKPMQGSTYITYTAQGDTIEGYTVWPDLVEGAMDRAVMEDNPLLSPPLEHKVNQLKNKRTLDDKVDPTLIAPISTYFDLQKGSGFKLWEVDESLQMDTPVPITNSPTTPSFCYVDLNKLTEGATPDFDGFLTAMPECVRSVFMATVYATVYAPCHHPLVVWMHGEGANGKSQFFDALNNYFSGNLVGSITTQQAVSDFGMEPLIGKRVIIFGDCQSGNILSTNVVHGITGGDTISVNRKNKTGISYKFEAQLFIGSNTAPNIKLNAMNETRRILYIPMGDPDKKVMQKYCEVDANGEIKRRPNGQVLLKSYDLVGRLTKEMPHILHKCKEHFDIHCKKPYNQISVPAEAFDLMAQACENGQNLVIAEWLSENFQITGEATDMINVAEMHSQYLGHIYGDNAKQQASKYNFDVAELSRFLLSTYKGKIERTRKIKNGSRVPVYAGIRMVM